MSDVAVHAASVVWFAPQVEQGVQLPSVVPFGEKVPGAQGPQTVSELFVHGTVRLPGPHASEAAEAQAEHCASDGSVEKVEPAMHVLHAVSVVGEQGEVTWPSRHVVPPFTTLGSVQLLHARMLAAPGLELHVFAGHCVHAASPAAA